MWWNPILESPIEYGILEACNIDEVTKRNISKINEMLNAIFTQQAPKSIQNSYINRYIESL